MRRGGLWLFDLRSLIPALFLFLVFLISQHSLHQISLSYRLPRSSVGVSLPSFISSTTSTVHPPLSCSFFIGIFSHPLNFQRRMAQRETWLRLLRDAPSGTYCYHFYMGHPSMNNLTGAEEARLDAEQTVFGDIRYINFTEAYLSLTEKILLMMHDVTRRVEFRWFMKADDDAFVAIDRVFSQVQRYPERLFWGRMFEEASPFREQDNRWYMSEGRYPYAFYPPYANGPAVVLTGDMVRQVLVYARRQKAAGITDLIPFDDTFIGEALNEVPVRRIHTPRFPDEAKDCGRRTWICHRQTREEMWEFYRMHYSK
eukprot:gb/GECH01006228.1/.p1 GENE.gb/GECH01006228.1/~~gb/GECH01006228.1/.p1  ORF type:complete len:313 (+),score=66.87 gb/GECH01006228.1/:1-939(+)